MKYRNTIFLIMGLIIFFLAGCDQQTEYTGITDEGYSFAFITDIHLQPERNAPQGFSLAIDTLNALNPDFVITGGDLIMDALGQSYERSDSLYNLYQESAGKLKMPVYNTIGNHEIYGIYHKSNADRQHPEFGEKMFEKRLGRSYYSFNHKGWHFMILNSIEEAEEGDAYEGRVDSVQMDWIREDLRNVDPETPIIISTHIPMATSFYEVFENPLYDVRRSDVVVNTPEVLQLFENHNLKLVLQGHLHILEEIKLRGITFVTAGAVSGRWWRGAHYGVEEGFVMVNLSGDDFDWEYVDYGWEVQPAE
jgi:3',5'-cyclic-AMP phosphodiesterase